MQFSDFANKKVVIMGLGLNGGGLESARFFYNAGCDVVVTDLQSAEILRTTIDRLSDCPNITYHLGGHNNEDFINADYIIKNPGVPPSSPFLKVAYDNGVIVTSDLEVFLNLAKPKSLIGITGTKGKSTTSTFISQILTANGIDNILAGNIGKSPLNSLGQEKEKIAVIELSSFQIDDLGVENGYFDLVVFTNIFPDHLNRYGTFEKYQEAKMRLIKYLKSDGKVICPLNNFSTPKLIDSQKSISFDQKYKFSLENDTPENQMNFNAAVLAVSELTSKSPEVIIANIDTLNPPRFRNQTTRKIGEISFINDSTATNPTVAITTLKNYASDKTLVILGGSDKDLPVKDLADFINLHQYHVAIIKSPVGEKLLTLIQAELVVVTSENFKEIILKSYDYLKINKGNFLILSPAAASFGLFLNEFDRGEQFDNIAFQIS